MSYGESIGHKFSVLDIGGGYAGHSFLMNNVKELSVALNEAMDELVSKHPTLDRIIAEPGTPLTD